MSILATAVGTVGTVALLADDVAPDDDLVRPGPIAFFIFVAFAVATFFLWRSMNKRLKRLPPTFRGDQIPGPGDTGPAEDPSSATGAPEGDPDDSSGPDRL